MVYLFQRVENNEKDNMYAFISPVDKRTFKQKAAVLKYLKKLMDTQSQQQLEEDIQLALDATTSEAEAEAEAEAILTNHILQSKRRRRRRHATVPPRNHPRGSPSTQHHYNSTTYRHVPYVLPDVLGIQTPYISQVSGVYLT